MKKASAHLVLTLCVALLAGCSATTPETGAARFAVAAPQALSSGITRVSVTSSGADIPSVTLDLAPTNGVWGGTIGNIPAGVGRAFLARAFDASGALRFEGSATGVIISANQTTLVAITLQQVAPPPPFENEAPVIDSLVASSTSVPAGGSISLVATAHDPNPGDSLTFTWSATAGTFSSPSSPSTSWEAPASTGIQTLTFTVTDSRGLSSSIVLAINVIHDGGEGEAELSISFNSAPRVINLRATPTQLVVGQTTSVSVSAVDPDGDGLSYAWSATCAGTWAQATSRVARFTPSLVPAGACNNCSLTVSVSDGRGGSNTGTVALCVRDAFPGSHLAPVISRSYRSADTATPGQVLTYEVVASDPQGSALTFSWAANTGTPGAPDSDASSSRITWTAPPCVVVGAVPTLTATVTNAFNLSVTRSFTVTGLPACEEGWRFTGPMGDTPREGHVAVLLPDGTVLIAGGSAEKLSFYLKTAERYDPVSDTWSPTGSMVVARNSATATLLSTGKVLVVGGEGLDPASATAELYDPTSGTWHATGSMAEPRVWHQATLLPDGRVLVTGGLNLEGTLATAELYDPVSGSWSATASMSQPRAFHTATLLHNGKVLVASGTSAELYDPASGTWGATGAPLEPAGRPAVLLLDGRVLVAGGTTAQVYDPASGTWSIVSSPPGPVEGPATLLLDGRVLFVGGETARLYDPVSDTWDVTPPMAVVRAGHTATRLTDGRVLVVGTPPNTEMEKESAELYTPGPP